MIVSLFFLGVHEIRNPKTKFKNYKIGSASMEIPFLSRRAFTVDGEVV